jgi:Predicted signal transduction protein with a C-terminal ATPase domain
MLEKLSDILHYALDDKNSIVPVYDEFRITNSYLSIQKTRNRHNLDSVWSLSDIDTAATLPKLILQPIIENSIQHGMNSKQSPMLITIKLESDKRYLKISIADDGKGMDEETLAAIKQRMNQAELSSKHIGLTNTSRRLKLIYGEQARLEIESKVNCGTTVTLMIPQEK